MGNELKREKERECFDVRGAVENCISAEGLQTLKPDAAVQSWAWTCVHSKGLPEIYLETPNHPSIRQLQIKDLMWPYTEACSNFPFLLFLSFCLSLSVSFSVSHAVTESWENSPCLGQALHHTVSTLSASNRLYEKSKHLKDQLCPAYTVSMTNMMWWN